MFNESFFRYSYLYGFKYHFINRISVLGYTDYLRDIRNIFRDCGIKSILLLICLKVEQRWSPSKYIFSSSSLIDRYKFIIKQRDREIRKIFFPRFADTHMLIFSQQSQIISKNFRSKYTFHIRETIRVIIYRSWKKRKKKKERKKERGTRISIKKKEVWKKQRCFI